MLFPPSAAVCLISLCSFLALRGHLPQPRRLIHHRSSHPPKVQLFFNFLNCQICFFPSDYKRIIHSDVNMKPVMDV